MKSATTFAISALVALAAAVPLEKRDQYTTTVIDEVTQTVDVVTTVWVQPGDPRLLAHEAANAANNQPAPAPAPAQSTTTSVPVSAPPQASSIPAAASVQPVPQQKEVVQPPPTSTPAPATAPVVTAAVAPAHSPATSPSSAPASSGSTGGSGGACGTVSGTCTAGDVTTFDGSGAAGACGYEDPLGPMGDNYFALAVGMMGSESNNPGVSMNPYCNRTADIVYNGKTHHTVLTDKCPGCAGGDQSLDLSPSLFAQIFDGATTGNFHNIEWYFTS